jgi:hypothetical protein
MLEQLAYYACRANAERQMAANSADEATAGVHLRMAELYERMVQVEQAVDPTQSIPSGENLQTPL